jgi:hypothetical protein
MSKAIRGPLHIALPVARIPRIALASSIAGYSQPPEHR